MLNQIGSYGGATKSLGMGASRSAEQHVCGLFAVCARTIPRVVAQVVA